MQLNYGYKARVTIEDNKLRCSFGVIEGSVPLTATYDLRVDLQNVHDSNTS